LVEGEEEAVMAMRRLTLDEAPERFSYAKGDRVARVREDGQPDVDQSGVIVEGVFEESASNIGGGSYDVVYTIRCPGGHFRAREVEVRKIPLDRTTESRCPDPNCSSRDVAHLGGSVGENPTDELWECSACGVPFWRVVPTL